MVESRPRRARLVIPRKSRHAVERPPWLPDERPTETGVQNRPEVDAGKAIAFEFLARRQTDDLGQLALAAQHAEIALGGRLVVAVRAHGGRRGIDQPDQSATMGREVGAG